MSFKDKKTLRKEYLLEIEVLDMAIPLLEKQKSHFEYTEDFEELREVTELLNSFRDRRLKLIVALEILGK